MRYGGGDIEGTSNTAADTRSVPQTCVPLPSVFPPNDQLSCNLTDRWTERKESLQNQRGSQTHTYFLGRRWKSEPSLAMCSSCLSMCSTRTLSDPALLRQISARLCVGNGATLPYSCSMQFLQHPTHMIAPCTSSGNLGRNVNYRTLITYLQVRIRMTWSLLDCASAFSLSTSSCQVSHHSLLSYYVGALQIFPALKAFIRLSITPVA